jgi:hypothetical protein
MAEIKSADFQKTAGTQFLRDLVESGESGMVVAERAGRNGSDGVVLRQVKITHLVDYVGASISCRDIKAGGVSAMIENVKKGNKIMHARLGGTKFFEMEIA